MYQRATLIGTLDKDADNGAINNPTSLAGSSISASDRAAGRPKRAPSAKYIPVYHIELVRDRVIKVEPRPAIHNSDDVVAILRDELLHADREKLISLMLNTKNVVIGLDVVSVGSLSASIAHPREIFKSAILKNAAAIILVHNSCGAAHELCARIIAAAFLRMADLKISRGCAMLADRLPTETTSMPITTFLVFSIRLTSFSRSAWRSSSRRIATTSSEL